MKNNELLPFKYGYLGVEWFFIISGFVISMSLYRYNNIISFFKGRFFRLYPIYWVCLTITFAVTTIWSLPGRTFDLTTYFINFSMIQNYINIPSIDGVYWSLHIELLFYFVISVLFYKIKTKIKMPDYSIILAYLVVLFTYSFVEFKSSYFETYFMTKYGIFFISGFLFFKLKSHNKKYYLPLILLCWLSSLIDRDLYEFFIITFFYLLFFLLHFNLLAFLENKFLITLGSMSYVLYLTHQNIGYVLLIYLKSLVGYKFSIILTIILVICLSWLIHQYIESPILKLSKKKLKKG
jgi:peptidoglycan/LPS O-acetylase OafA/YrhL